MKICILGILLFGFALLLHQTTQNFSLGDKKRQEVAQKVLGRSIRSEQPEEAWTEYKGTFFSLQYPKTARILGQTNVSTESAVLETFSFDTLDPRVTFTAAVIDDPTLKTAQEFSGIRLRRSDTTYREESIIIDSQPALFFIKTTGGGEITAFLSESNYIYTFSASSFQNSDQLDIMFQKIVSSIKIRD